MSHPAAGTPVSLTPGAGSGKLCGAEVLKVLLLL